MKIAIMGYSGSGKSSLARILSQRYNLPVLHLDTVQFLANWQERDHEERIEIVNAFLYDNDSWIIDGNYSSLYYQRRIEEADIIILLLFSRINCLYRCFKRYLKYQGQSRPDITTGCNEKIDLEFIKWILFDGRTKEIQNRYKTISNKYKAKVVVLKNQHQLDEYLRNIKQPVR